MRTIYAVSFAPRTSSKVPAATVLAISDLTEKKLVRKLSAELDMKATEVRTNGWNPIIWSALKKDLIPFRMASPIFSVMKTGETDALIEKAFTPAKKTVREAVKATIQAATPSRFEGELTALRRDVDRMGQQLNELLDHLTKPVVAAAPVTRKKREFQGNMEWVQQIRNSHIMKDPGRYAIPLEAFRYVLTLSPELEAAFTADKGRGGIYRSLAAAVRVATGWGSRDIHLRPKGLGSVGVNVLWFGTPEMLSMVFALHISKREELYKTLLAAARPDDPRRRADVA